MKVLVSCFREKVWHDHKPSKRKKDKKKSCPERLSHSWTLRRVTNTTEHHSSSMRDVEERRAMPKSCRTFLKSQKTSEDVGACRRMSWNIVERGSNVSQRSRTSVGHLSQAGAGRAVSAAREARNSCSSRRARDSRDLQQKEYIE